MKINGKRVAVIYQETYSDEAVLKDSLLPELKHINAGYCVTYAQLLKVGRLKDGREFQEIRVVLDEVK